MTIDELIERLNDLKAIAKHGGETQVAVDLDTDYGQLEFCVVELQPCVQVGKGLWQVTDNTNDTEVVRIN